MKIDNVIQKLKKRVEPNYFLNKPFITLTLGIRQRTSRDSGIRWHNCRVMIETTCRYLNREIITSSYLQDHQRRRDQTLPLSLSKWNKKHRVQYKPLLFKCILTFEINRTHDAPGDAIYPSFVGRLLQVCSQYGGVSIWPSPSGKREEKTLPFDSNRSVSFTVSYGYELLNLPLSVENRLSPLAQPHCRHYWSQLRETRHVCHVRHGRNFFCEKLQIYTFDWSWAGSPEHCAKHSHANEPMVN